jgi:putative acetyltransferase
MLAGTDVEVRAPRHGLEDEAVKALFVEYARSLGFSLDYQGFAQELAGFPGAYAGPTGALRVAVADGVVVGAVGLRRLEPECCEMKRLYVRPECRALRTRDGASIGRALAGAIVDAGRELGYRRMRLDTIAGKMGAAIQLYRTMGFVEIPAYYASPVPGTVYFERLL